MEKVIVPKDFKRSLEVIVKQNPTMTGKEILKELAYDEACYKLFQNKLNQEFSDIVDWLNKVKYIKISYLEGCVYYLEITKAWLDTHIYFNAFKSTLNTGSSKKKDCSIFVESRIKVSYEQYDNYFNNSLKVEEITKEQYEKFLTAVEDLYEI